MAQKKAKVIDPIDEFLALPDEEKQRVWESFNRVIPDSECEPLAAEDVAAFKRRRVKPGRPKIGQGAQRIQLTVEKGLLAKADAYAKAHGLSRAQVFARGLAKLRIA